MTNELSAQFVTQLVQQGLEKIDNVRALAGEILTRIVHVHRPSLPCIPHLAELRDIIPRCVGSSGESP